MWWVEKEVVEVEFWGGMGVEIDGVKGRGDGVVGWEGGGGGGGGDGEVEVMGSFGGVGREIDGVLILQYHFSQTSFPHLQSCLIFPLSPLPSPLVPRPHPPPSSLLSNPHSSHSSFIFVITFIFQLII